MAQLYAVCIDALDPFGQADFWAGVLGWERESDAGSDAGSATGSATGSLGGIGLLPSDDTGFRIRFTPTGEPKTGPNAMHFDLTSSSPADQQQTVARAVGLGARPIDVGQRPDEGHLVLADPEGNELCVIGPDNAFLAECGFVGALSCDGPREVGQFWSQALGWPLVRDQDEETAIRSPHGGPKITWGRPPLAPRSGRSRVHFDLVPSNGGELHEEVDRLVALGARQIAVGQSLVGHTGIGRLVLADPGGNDFCLLLPS